MKFSYAWLNELVPDLTAPPIELERLITVKTAECEGVEAVGSHFATVVAARVISVDNLGDTKNRSVLVDVGRGKEVRVVCGAPNVSPGMLAPWVPPGSILHGKRIGRAVISGIESDGMLASAAELGVSRDHSGLLELHGIAPGDTLTGLAPDWIIEIDNKSLTNRPDLWGHHGMAREVAAITGNALLDPVDDTVLPTGAALVKVEIADYLLCPRYSALMLENIRIRPAPLPLQARLESVGFKSINNVVDTTNYILAELPQPMHAFDADKLTGDTIYVRLALPGERLHALNDETYVLTESDLVIADGAGPVALAGVIGGAKTAISETTTRILLESANFEASGVRLSSMRHKLRTDASMRFEKSLDPENTVRGLARAVSLLRELSLGIRPVGGVADARVPPVSADPIALPLSFVARKLGKQLAEPEVSGILRSLGFGVANSSPGLLTVTVPTWRATKDISLKDDLVEEVGRMIGYGEIVPAPPRAATTVPAENPMRLFLRGLRRMLTDQGFTEVYNYSFVSAADVERFNIETADLIGVLNPIASDLTHLRQSLLPGLFKNILSNVHNGSEFRLFEIGREIRPGPGSKLPVEITHLAAALYDTHADELTFFEMKRVTECLFAGSRLEAAREVRAYEHPTRTAHIVWNDARIGRLFELHPSLLAAEGIDGTAILFDIDLRLSLELAAKGRSTYKPPRKYPISGFDLSVVADARMPVGEIERHLRTLTGVTLVSLAFIRQYDGPPLLEGQKSVSYHLEVGALDRTLTSEQVALIREQIVNGMHEAGFEIRGLD